VAPGVVVGSVLLAGHQLLGVEQLTIRASSYLENHRRKNHGQDPKAFNLDSSP
jgi:hypothetical protein